MLHATEATWPTGVRARFGFRYLMMASVDASGHRWESGLHHSETRIQARAPTKKDKKRKTGGEGGETVKHLLK